MFNPFGMSVIDRVMQNIRESLDRRWRPVWLVYNDPVYVTPVKQSLQLREVMNYTYGGHDFIVLSNDSAGLRSH